jgi:hypothetical protein
MILLVWQSHAGCNLQNCDGLIVRPIISFSYNIFLKWHSFDLHSDSGPDSPIPEPREAAVTGVHLGLLCPICEQPQSVNGFERTDLESFNFPAPCNARTSRARGVENIVDYAGVLWSCQCSKNSKHGPFSQIGGIRLWSRLSTQWPGARPSNAQYRRKPGDRHSLTAARFWIL